MRGWRRFALVLGVTSVLVPVPSHAAGAVHLQASFFRFCSASDAACQVSDSPHVTNVTAGQTIDWIFNDPACDALMSCGHNVTFADGEGGSTLHGDTLSDPLASDHPELFSRTFDQPGTYQYWCSAHKGFGMLGTVVVTAPGVS